MLPGMEELLRRLEKWLQTNRAEFFESLNPGVTDKELRRWVAGYRLQTISNMQSDTSKAASIGDGASNMGDPVGVFRLLERAQRLTPADVQAAANKYMTADRVVLSTVPVGKIELRSKPDLKYTDVTRGKKP